MASRLRCEKPLLAQLYASDPFGDARTQPNRLRVQRSSSDGLSFDFNYASAGSRSIGHYVIGLNGSCDHAREHADDGQQYLALAGPGLR